MLDKRKQYVYNTLCVSLSETVLRLSINKQQVAGIRFTDWKIHFQEPLWFCVVRVSNCLSIFYGTKSFRAIFLDSFCSQTKN